MSIRQVSTKNTDHEQWLEARKKTIGGSEASAIVGLNPWCSPYALWAQKKGHTPQIADNESMRQGRDLEEYVAQRFSEATGKKVKRKNAILYNDDFPFAHANVDRLIVGEEAGLECKTTKSLNLKQFKNGEFPATYYVQCQHYMMVTGYKKWYLAVLIFGTEFLWFEIPRNDEDIEALRAAEQDFHSKYIAGNDEPPVDGMNCTSDAVEDAHSDADPKKSIDLGAVGEAIRRITEAKKSIEELQKIKAEAENEIKVYMDSATIGQTDTHRITWKPQMRTTFDSKAFAADNPDLDISGYYKHSTSRVFKIMEV